MGKKIRIIPLLLLLMFAVTGCGRQGKVSDRKYQAALEAFEEYYEDELQDTYEYTVARIYMDAEGMPLMFVMATEELEEYDEPMYDYMMFACVKGEVVSVMDYSGFDDATDGGIGIGLYTDGIISVAEYRQRRDEYDQNNYEEYFEIAQTWYQIRGDQCTEIAQRDLVQSLAEAESPSEDEEERAKKREWFQERREVNPREIRFVLGKREYVFDLYGDDVKERDNVYKRVCNKLYSGNARGSKACQLWWKDELVLNQELPYLFMRSLPFSNNFCYDAKSFRRQISDLKKQGSKSNDEFLVWDINEYSKKGYGEGRDAYYLMYRDPLLLNETELVKKWDEDDSYHRTVLRQLITYVMATKDYRIIEKLDFIDTISLKTMKKQTGEHLLYYLNEQDEATREGSNWQIWSGDYVDNESAMEWFGNNAGDMLEENLKGENSADYLKAYIKYLAKKGESVRDEFDTQEMALSAYEYVSKKDSRLKGAGFALGQIGEGNELCMLTDRGVLTYDHGRVYTYFLDDNEAYYWNEQTNELLFIESGYYRSGPWNEYWDETPAVDYGAEASIAEAPPEVTESGAEIGDVPESIGAWLYQFRNVEDGKLSATCDYYLDYDNEEAYFRDWQTGENPEYEEMDWEECLDSLWQRRCGNDYEESGMEKDELDRKTPCFSDQTDMMESRQNTVRLYPSVDKACEKFQESGTAAIEVVAPYAEQEEGAAADDEVKKDAYIYALEHDPEISEEIDLNRDSLSYTFLRVGENRELCLVVSEDYSGERLLWLIMYRDGKAVLGRKNNYFDTTWFWNEKTGYLYESSGHGGYYDDLVWTVTDGVEYTIRRGEYEEIYTGGEDYEYKCILTGNEEPVIEAGHSLSSVREEEKELLKPREVTKQEYDSAILEANGGLTTEQMYGIFELQFFDTMEAAYEAIQSDPGANCVKEVQSVSEAAPALSEIDVEAEVGQIREWFTETQSNLSEYDVYVDADGVVHYSNAENGLAKVVVPKGHGGLDYERDYYYYDGELYFAFLFAGGEEHRLYFRYGTLIRYIDPNKNTHDYGDTDAFETLADGLSQEAALYD